MNTISFYILFYLVTFFFLVKVMKILFLKKYYFNLINFLELYLKKFMFVIDQGLFISNVLVFFMLKQDLVFHYFKLSMLYFKYYSVLSYNKIIVNILDIALENIFSFTEDFILLILKKTLLQHHG